MCLKDGFTSDLHAMSIADNQSAPVISFVCVCECFLPVVRFWCIYVDISQMLNDF